MRLLQLTIVSNIVLLAAVLIGVPWVAAPQKSEGTSGKNAPEKLPFADSRNVTVMVFFADPPPQQGMLPIVHANASGSGVWVGKKGYIATCQHVTAPWTGPFKIGFARDAYVAEGGLTITVGASVNFWDADLIASDPDSDVAILKAHVSPSNAEPPPLVTGNSVVGEQVITPQIQIKPKGTDLRTDFPAPGETLLLAGYPIGLRTLILQVGPATGVDFPGNSRSHTASGLRIFLSLVSNPGNSGGPILDTSGRLVGLLEGNLPSPIRDSQGRQLLSPTLKYDSAGNLVRDSSGQFVYDITPLNQNSGISIAVPARAIAELAKKNNISLE
jgi:S1-C subfamily serine protease